MPFINALFEISTGRPARATLVACLVLLGTAVDESSAASPLCKGSCCDKHEPCSYWAQINECTRNPDWMLPNCQLSCNACNSSASYKRCRGNCCDKHESCSYWAKINECTRNPDWMLPNCQLSCKSCNSVSDVNTQRSPGCIGYCCDKEKNCAIWARNNECINNKSFMMRKCKMSCNACAPKPRPQPLETCGNNGMTTALRRKFLDMHNKYRSLVAKGQARDRYGGYAPRAARMLKMEYDCKIEYNAMQHAKRCVLGHSPDHTREDLGENLYWNRRPRMDKSQATEQAVKAWFNELAEFGVGQQNVLTQQLWNRPRTQIGHYTQMVWQDTDRLGCYVEWCYDMTSVVCQYGPRGNWIGDLIYELGNPCTRDSDCKCNNCKCSREEALCIVQ